MARVVWLPRAIDDLRSIISYINQFDPGAAQRLGARLLELGDSLSDFPRRGRPNADHTRELATAPPYVIRYQVEDDVVLILSIRHGARNSD